MAAKPRRTIPAASGYPQYSGYLSHCIVSDELVARFYCASVFGEITTTDYMGELTKRGDQITFYRRPVVSIHDYTKDMILKSDTLETDTVTLSIDKAKYFNLKIDMVDEYQLGDMWDKFLEAFMEEATNKMKVAIDSEILCSIYADADCKNRGANAGCSTGRYNLGSIGAPLIIDKNNIGELFMSFAAVLDEACIPEEDRFIVLPPHFKVILSQSDWGKCCFQDNAQDLFLNGKLPGKIAGFTIYISNRVSYVFDTAANTWVYNIVAGWKGSTAFALQMERTRIHTTDRSFDKFYQGLMVYGFDTLYPNGLLHIYAKFQ